jgi:hypothetical protein
MKAKYLKLLVLALSFSTIQSCNYLDVSDEQAGGLTSFDEVFDNVDYTRRWYGWIFTAVPNPTLTFSTAGMGNVWASYADELYMRLALAAGKYGETGVANGTSGRWDIYGQIRQANIFLERAKAIVEELGVDAKKITEEEMIWYKANVRFLRAAYHFYLMELYGPIPIVDHSLTLQDDLDLPRNSLDEVIEFIDSELLLAIPDLAQEPYHSNEQFRAMPTKGTALALRAKLWAYAASPLFNGGFTEALGITNHDGKVLFPPQDNSKKQKALEASRDFINYAQGRYDLHDMGDPAVSVYQVFQNYTTEIIWGRANVNWGSLASGDSNSDRYSTPRSEPNGVGDIGPVQELVDDFYMSDGLPIKATSFLPASPLYSETGFTTVGGVEVFNMYMNREPRFYNSVCYSGMRWHKGGSTSSTNDNSTDWFSGNEVQFWKGGTGDNTQEGCPQTGYLWYKRYNRRINGTTVTSAYRPGIIFRLADFYLLHAEVLNEVEPGNPDVLEYVNLVRRRAGLPDLQTLNPAIAGNYAMQRDAIRHERRIELAGEGQRYFDVRRWMIAEDENGRQGGDFHGMYLDGNQTTFYTRTRMHSRAFSPKNYFYAIPYTQMQKTTALVQNPGWGD